MADDISTNGWIPFSQRTKEQTELHERVVSGMPKFALPVKDDGRYPLWKLARQGLGMSDLPYAWQVTGSCVGAGGYNTALTRMGVDIQLGEAEEFQQIFWAWTFGQSRRLGGIRGRGEGSFGAAYFKAVEECGYFSMAEAAAKNLKVPQFRQLGNWIQLTKNDELTFSDGGAFAGEPWAGLGKQHLITAGAQATTVRDVLGFLQNGYPCSMASMFGTRTITRQDSGDGVVNVARWDDEWAHQMYLDECWKTPKLGWIFRVGNNWGPDIHPAPTGGEPAGGFYITEATLEKILAQGTEKSEVFGFGNLNGFQAREITWYI